MLSYKISPKCTAPNGATLYLSVNKQTEDLTVWTELSNNDPSQVWIPVLWVNTSGTQGFALQNVWSKKVIAAPKNDAAVIQIPVDEMEGQKCSWNYSASTRNYSALQLHQDNGLNLNVRGNGPYPNGTQVLAYGWSGGDPNEVWIFIPVIS